MRWRLSAPGAGQESQLRAGDHLGGLGRWALRIGRRATAPFSRGKPNPAPKKPGRRAGERRFERRAMPVPGPMDRVDDIHVPLDSPDCPRCGASLEVVEQTASVETRCRNPSAAFSVSVWSTAVATSAGGRDGGGMRASQPVSTERPRNAPACNVMAQALTLHFHCGLPLSKVPEVILAATGIRLTQSALTQAAAALAAEGGVVHTPIRNSGPPSLLLRWSTPTTPDGASVARGPFSWVFSRRSLRCFRSGGSLRNNCAIGGSRTLTISGYWTGSGGSTIGTGCCEHPEIEPTTNRAERGLRRAVIVRKVSHCSKNERGVRTYEAMKSVTGTVALRGHSAARALADLVQGRPMPEALAR